MKKLYIEIPDEQGNCAYLIAHGFSASPCVIEAERVSYQFGEILVVSSPKEFAQK